MKPSLALAILVITAGFARADDTTPRDEKLDPQQHYTAKKSQPVAYDLELVAAVTAPYHTKTLKVWLPMPPSDNVQTVESRGFDVFPNNVKPKIETERVYGNRFAYFEFDHPEGAQIIRHKLRVTTHQLDWELGEANIERPATWPKDFAPYLDSDQAVVVNATIAAEARKIVGKAARPSEDLERVMRWMHNTMKYDHGAASLAASSLHAFETHAGHCSDYHGLCSALGRALGYPTRVTYGLNLFPKNSPSHCKLEVFLPPHGWVSFDVSETQKLMNAIGKDTKLSAAEQQKLQDAAFARLQRGFRDNTWLLQTRGTGYDLAPPAAKKVNVVRTLYAEADGVALPEPDPADASKKEFAWQVGIKVTSDKAVKYPFKYP